MAWFEENILLPEQPIITMKLLSFSRYSEILAKIAKILHPTPILGHFSCVIL